MKIGDMSNTLNTIFRNQAQFVNDYNKQQLQLSTGKRVNRPEDDPGDLKRINDLKINISRSDVVQRSLNDTLNKNSSMENTLQSLNPYNSALSNLASLSQQSGFSQQDQAEIQSLAKNLLDAMVSTFASTQYNGVNPFQNPTKSVQTSSGGSISIPTTSFYMQKNATNPCNYDITLNDGTKLSNQSVSNILTPSYIQNNLVDQTSMASATLGTAGQIVSNTLNLEQSQQAVMTSALSNLQDANLGQVATQAKVDQQMISLNQGVISGYSGTFSGVVGSIIDLRA